MRLPRSDNSSGYIGGRSLGALAGKQVELGQLLALFRRSSSGDAAVELVDNLENGLLPACRRRMCHEQPADPQVGFGARFLGDQRIGRLVHAIMLEP